MQSGHTDPRHIAEAFYLTHDIEKYGSGYLRVRKEVADYPTMNFQYKELGGGYFVELKYTEQRVESSPKSTDVLLNEGLSEGLNEGLNGLLMAIKASQGIQAKDLAKRLNRPIKTIERQIKSLTDKERIERRGSKKTGGYWIVGNPPSEK